MSRPHFALGIVLLLILQISSCSANNGLGINNSRLKEIRAKVSEYLWFPENGWTIEDYKQLSSFAGIFDADKFNKIDFLGLEYIKSQIRHTKYHVGSTGVNIYVNKPTIEFIRSLNVVPLKNGEKRNGSFIILKIAFDSIATISEYDHNNSIQCYEEKPDRQFQYIVLERDDAGIIKIIDILPSIDDRTSTPTEYISLNFINSDESYFDKFLFPKNDNAKINWIKNYNTN